MTDNERLAIIETKVDALTTLVTEVIAKHDKRIRVNERFRNIITGGILVVSGGGAALWKYLTGAN